MASVDVGAVIRQRSFHEQFCCAGSKSCCVLCHASKRASVLREHLFNNQRCNIVVVVENLNDNFGT
jgi:hypothetical protein